MGALRILTVDVRPNHIEALVQVTQERFMRTADTTDLAERAFRLMPGLARHRCENDAGLSPLEEFGDTETPHLLEHVTLELMAMAGSPRSLKGATSWDFSADGRGAFRLRIGYDDDLVALGALRLGAEVVDWLLGEAEQPPVRVGVARLRAERRTAR